MTNTDPDFEEGQNNPPDGGKEPEATKPANLKTFRKEQDVLYKGQPARITSLDPLDLHLVDKESGEPLLNEQKQPIWFGAVDPDDVEAI